MESLDKSFDESDMTAVNNVIAEFHGQDLHENILSHHIQPSKKLSEVFDGCVKSETNNMKVFLRVRPSSNKNSDSTIQVSSSTTIVTTAPENSKRAQYTKTEERNYVRHSNSR